jgi:hypothetical protein
LGTSLIQDDQEYISSQSDRFSQITPNSANPRQNTPNLDENRQVIYGSGEGQTATKMTGYIPEDALRQHQETMLDKHAMDKLPKNEIF